MKSILFIFILSFFHFFIFNSYSQGCSDPGICNLNSFKAKQADSLDNKYKSQLKLGGSYGKADHNIKVTGGFFEFHKDVDSTSSVDIRFTYLAHQNELVTSYGPSDLFLNTNWQIVKNWILTFGCKIALTNGNAALNEKALPMDFQSSLGTFDVILGLSYKIGDMQLFLASQLPLNKSKNKFNANDPTDLKGDFREYQTTYNYKRKGDILFRAAYQFVLDKHITITPSLLPIYHIDNDEYTDQSNQQALITGSKGLTLNGNLFIDFALNKRNKISLSLAAPFVTRKVRPDGLTRKYVAGLEYAIRF